MTPTDPNWKHDLSVALVNLGVVALIATAGLFSVLRVVEMGRPCVGDIVMFGPSRYATFDTQARITVLPLGVPAPRPCVLDARIMRASGGSLVIEAKWPEPRIHYQVHWVGKRTSDGATDCGAAGAFRLDQTDLSALKMAAGG